MGEYNSLGVYKHYSENAITVDVGSVKQCLNWPNEHICFLAVGTTAEVNSTFLILKFDPV